MVLQIAAGVVLGGLVLKFVLSPLGKATVGVLGIAAVSLILHGALIFLALDWPGIARRVEGMPQWAIGCVLVALVLHSLLVGYHGYAGLWRLGREVRGGESLTWGKFSNAVENAYATAATVVLALSCLIVPFVAWSVDEGKAGIVGMLIGCSMLGFYGFYGVKRWLIPADVSAFVVAPLVFLGGFFGVLIFGEMDNPRTEWIGQLFVLGMVTSLLVFLVWRALRKRAAVRKSEAA